MAAEILAPPEDLKLETMAKLFANKVRVNDFGMICYIEEKPILTIFPKHAELDEALKVKVKSDVYLAFYRNQAGKVTFIYNSEKSSGSGTLQNGKVKYLKINSLT